MTIMSDNQCQLCLTENESILPIFSNSEIGGPTLSAKIMICLSLPIEGNNEFSNKICGICEEKVTQFYEFREKCLKTYYSMTYNESQNFENLYGTNEEKTEITIEHEETLDSPEKTGEIILSCPMEESENSEEKADESSNIHESMNDQMIFMKPEPVNFYEYKCLHCNNLFSNFDAASIHCMECNNISKERELCENSISPPKESTEETNYDNSQENNIPNDSTELISTKRYFECSECKNKFSSKSAVKRHMFVHTGERPFTCEICEKTFSQIGQLNFHRKLHINPRYRCKVCSKPFLRPSDMEKHLRIHTGEKPFTCKICDKSFTQSIALKQHERIHTGHKPYACEICGKTFSQNANKMKHLKIHKEGMKPHTCDICGRSFSEYEEMLLHRDGHGGGKPRICNYCDQGFRKRSELSDHIRRYHTFERPHKCAFCSKSFFVLYSLKQHILLHTGHKPFSCTECNLKFTQKGNLKKHFDRVHNNKKGGIDKSEVND